MASRTGTSVGVGVAVAILSVLALGFFVTSIVFYGQFQGARRDLLNQQSQQAEIIKTDERQRDDVVALLDEAKRGRMSLVGYLADTTQKGMTMVTGDRRTTLARLQEQVQQIEGAANTPLLQVLRERDSRLGSLQSQYTKANADLQAALADLQNEQARVQSIEARYQDLLNGLNSDVARNTEMVTQFRDGSERLRSTMDERIAEVEQQAREREERLSGEVTRLQEELAVSRGMIASLRGERSGQMLRPDDEASLVDGRVVSINPGDRQVIVGIGRRDNAVLGMTFSVYPSGAQITPDEEGEYPPGKAALEIISVDESTSVARVLTEARGNPIVPGDVIANPIYDPNKVYTFVVFGAFDTDRDGVTTPRERTDLVALIESWGGRVVDDLTGDVDFLVLGGRPELPPRPSTTAPVEVMLRWIEQDRGVRRYDELFQRAGSTGIPVLNENRLYTLLGGVPGARTAARP
jgi:hypothetical protein